MMTNYAGPSGEDVFPGVENLTRDTNSSRTTVIAKLRELERAELARKEGVRRRRDADEYRLTIPNESRILTQRSGLNHSERVQISPPYGGLDFGPHQRTSGGTPHARPEARRATPPKTADQVHALFLEHWPHAELRVDEEDGPTTYARWGAVVVDVNYDEAGQVLFVVKVDVSGESRASVRSAVVGRVAALAESHGSRVGTFARDGYTYVEPDDPRLHQVESDLGEPALTAELVAEIAALPNELFGRKAAS